MEFPTARQFEILKDVSAHPDNSLAERAERVRTTRAAVHQVLYALEKKGLTARFEGKWSTTKAGKAVIQMKRKLKAL